MRAALVAAFALAFLAGGGAAVADQTPGASAQAWAVRVVVPGSPGGGTDAVVVPPASKQIGSASFSYPADGSIVSTGATRASASTALGADGEATASSGLAAVSIFGGEIVAAAVTADATAATHNHAAAGRFDGTGVTGLLAFGQPVTRSRFVLGGWGYLTLHASGVDTSAPAGAVGYHGFVTALDVHLTSAHAGLPAGSEIQLGYAEVDVQTAPQPPRAQVLPQAPGPALAVAGPLPGDRPQFLPPSLGPFIGMPQLMTPPLVGGPYVFPVYGQSSFIDTYGAFRPDVSFHHGDDIFGELGQPLVAVASGTVFSVGWNRLGGNRLWLRDHHGNLFYYAHLAAFTTDVRNGAHVHAGEVIGFMGDTGDAEGADVHLHFEVHPVSLLYLGYDGAVDPTGYVESWPRVQRLPFPVATGWAPSPPAAVRAPLPGAMLISSSDIATGGLRVAAKK